MWILASSAAGSRRFCSLRNCRVLLAGVAPVTGESVPGSRSALTMPAAVDGVFPPRSDCTQRSPARHWPSDLPLHLLPTSPALAGVLCSGFLRLVVSGRSRAMCASRGAWEGEAWSHRHGGPGGVSHASAGSTNTLGSVLKSLPAPYPMHTN